MKRPCTHTAASLSLGILLAALAGCSSIEPPTFDLIAVEKGPTAPTLSPEGPGQTTTLIFIVEGANSNDEPLPLRDVTYRAEIGDEPGFWGRRAALATLPAHGTWTFELPVPVNSEVANATGMEQYRLAGNIQYLLPGRLADLLFDAELRRPAAHFAFTGELDTSQ